MKKALYLVLTIILLMLLSVLLYGLLLSHFTPIESLIGIIAVFCVFAGYALGKYWWKYIYVDHKYRPRWGIKTKN